MDEKNVEDRLEDAAKLSPQEAKFTLLKGIDPTISDNKAAKLCGYAGKSGTQVRNRVAGKIGGLLAEHGLGLDTIAENIKKCIEAKKTKAVFRATYNEKGKQNGVDVEVLELGPDYQAIDRAIKTLIMLQKLGEVEEKVPQIPEHTSTPDISPEALETAAGRGGPVEVIEADFEEVEESDVATG